MSSLKNFLRPALNFGWWICWVNILLGCIFLASGFVFFISPYNIVPGGVYGASIVLHNLFPSIQVGTFGYMFDAPLLLLAFLLLGSNLGARTIVVSFTTPAIMNLLTHLVYPTEEAIRSLDPALLLGGVLDLSDHLMLTSVIGAVLIGLGSGIVARNRAITGGCDIVGMLLQKYMHIHFSSAILIVNAVVVCFGLLVIGFGVGSAGEVTQSSLHLSFYSLIAISITSRVVAYVINGSKEDKLLFVISDKKLHDLHHFILSELKRSATLIQSNGLYTGAEKEMLFLVVHRKEAVRLKQKIKEADPCAFVVLTDAYDTFGKGWKQLPSRGDIQPE